MKDVPESTLREEIERLQKAEALSRTGSWDYFPKTGTLWISNEAARLMGVYRPKDGIIACGDSESILPGWPLLKEAIGKLTGPGEEFNILFGIDISGSQGCRMINASGVLLAPEPEKTHIVGIVKEIPPSATFISDLPAQISTIMNTTGMESLDWICQTIRMWLNADCIMIGEIEHQNNQVNVLCMLRDGQMMRNFTYSLKGTPCEDVERKGICLYMENACRHFPEAKDLVDMNIQGYFGLPLKSHKGEIMGILCILTRQPLHPLPVIRNCIELVALKAAGEIEHRRVEEALGRNQKLLADAMDHAHMARWDYDANTHHFSFDDRFYSLYGTTAGREGGNHMPAETYIREFVHPEDQARVARALNRSIPGGESHQKATLMYRITRRDGEVRDIIVRADITRNKEGKIVRAYGADQDITGLRKAERALVQANRKINLLSSITRHDILNQITVIRSYLRYARRKIPDMAMSDYIEKLDRVTVKIQSQIAFTRIYQDLGSDRPRWFDLSEVIPSEQGDIRIQADCGGLAVYADPILPKVFENLLDNAIKHGKHVSQIRVTAAVNGDTARITWEDDGIGIPDAEKECIFEQGFGRNTGLGLFLAREILAITSMTIRECGKPEKGARFEITVPKGSYR
jgi:PAS domain S-box-containing protein